MPRSRCSQIWSGPCRPSGSNVHATTTEAAGRDSAAAEKAVGDSIKPPSVKMTAGGSELPSLGSLGAMHHGTPLRLPARKSDEPARVAQGMKSSAR